MDVARIGFTAGWTHFRCGFIFYVSLSHLLFPGSDLLCSGEVPVPYMADGAGGELGAVRAILSLHRAVQRTRVQECHCEYLLYWLISFLVRRPYISEHSNHSNLAPGATWTTGCYMSKATLENLSGSGLKILNAPQDIIWALCGQWNVLSWWKYSMCPPMFWMWDTAVLIYWIIKLQTLVFSFS